MLEHGLSPKTVKELPPVLRQDGEILEINLRNQILFAYFAQK